MYVDTDLQRNIFLLILVHEISLNKTNKQKKRNENEETQKDN